MLPLTLALPSETKHSSGFQSYSFSKAHLLPSAFKVQGRGLGRAHRPAQTGERKCWALQETKQPQQCTAAVHNRMLWVQVPLCARSSFSDQLTGWKLQGYPCLWPGTKPQAPLTAFWFDDFHCKLGANINVLLMRVYNNDRWLRACWK